MRDTQRCPRSPGGSSPSQTPSASSRRSTVLLLTRRDIEQLFGVSKAQGRDPHCRPSGPSSPATREPCPGRSSGSTEPRAGRDLERKLANLPDGVSVERDQARQHDRGRARARHARRRLRGRGDRRSPAPVPDGGRRTVRPQRVREAWSTGAEAAGAPWQPRRPPRSPGQQSEVRSAERAPRARGVFSGIRPMPPSAIRNQTWSPSGSNSAPNQKVPFGSRVGSRAVRVLAPPGRSSRVPSMTVASSSPVMP